MQAAEITPGHRLSSTLLHVTDLPCSQGGCRGLRAESVQHKLVKQHRYVLSAASTTGNGKRLSSWRRASVCIDPVSLIECDVSKGDRLARSPTGAFPGFTGQTPSAFTPTEILPRSSVSRMQPLMMIPCRKSQFLSRSILCIVLREFHTHHPPESYIASPHGASQPSHCCVALPHDSH